MLWASAGVYANGIENPVTWEVEMQPASGDTVELHFYAKIDTLWKVYAAYIPTTTMPLSLTITLDNDKVTALDIVEHTASKEAYDSIFEEQVRYFKREFHVVLPVIVGKKTNHIAGTVEYKSCNEATFACISPSYDFDVALPQAASTANAADAGSLWLFFLVAMLAGFAGVLTPCVFPMLPMTISFFMRQGSKRASHIQLLVFAISIVLIYGAIGIVVALTKSATFATTLSTHWLPNLIFFALFVAFAASFLGAFDLSLPQSWTNKIDAQADKGGYLGAFFVALTLCIVSFSCTGVFVGSLLVTAVSDGAVLKPIVGMFGFGLAFALPFTLLGWFPAVLKKLPKSGEWMNTLKVTFAFILIMFGMKFISVVDVDLGWNWMSRELFLTVWAVCLILWGLYIAGKIHLLHHSKTKTTSPLRWLIALLSFAAAIYLLTAFWGNKIMLLEGFLPEKSWLSDNTQSSDNRCGVSRFADNKTLTSPVPAYFDLQQALACAEQQNKPLLLYMKGHSCVNCKRMQGTVFTHPQILQVLQEKYIVAALYTDDKTELPQNEWYTSTFDGKVKKTMGQQNLDYLMTHYNVNSVPFFVIKNGNATATMGYTADADEFLRFLSLW
ncbi:thiol:disulfide interchange protein [Bacteroidia bacterium]|nr:thiol:disulfide interchange protein [Bacteroidia bacterium]